MSAAQTRGLIRGFAGCSLNSLIEQLFELKHAKQSCTCEIFGPDLIIFFEGSNLRLKMVDFAFARLEQEFSDRFTDSLENLIALLV